MAAKSICSIDGCDKPRESRGWCANHNRRWVKYGDPLGGRPSPGEGPRFYQDVVLPYADKDSCLAWPFGRTSKGYGKIWVDGKTHLVSRLACAHAHGEAPTLTHEAAHSCGKGHEGCVNPHHLRWATRTENFADKIIHGTNTGARRVHR